MLLRIWQGWTQPEDADAYERLLEDEILPAIAEQAGEGYRGHEVARRERSETVEYVTILRFASWEAVQRFAGENYETAHVPPEARELLVDWNDHADHFEVRRSEHV